MRKTFLLLSRLIFSLFLILPPPALQPSAPPRITAAGDIESYTYRLTQSTGSYQLWTTPPSERVFLDSAVPPTSGSEVKVYAARNEFEPFQLVVRPTASGPAQMQIGSFGAGITTQIYQVKYVNITQPSDSLGRTGPYPDPLWPVSNGASVSLTANQNTAFWFTVAVPSGTPAGEYATQVTVAGVAVPVRLHVFNFAIPDQLHVASQMNFSAETILEKYGVPGTGNEYWFYADLIKQFFIDHRLTPAGPLWPGGVTAGGSFAEPFINYDCASRTLSDPHGIWGFNDLAQRYLGGTGLLRGQFSTPFNQGTGFSTFMAATFRHNDPSDDQRPGSFCGVGRGAGDWLGDSNTAYNRVWSDYLTSLQNYLSSQGYLDEAYHYFANEPQDQADYNAVAWYSRLAHTAAPNLKLMVSEEPRPEIYNQPGAHIDIWMPVLNYYDPVVSHQREVQFGEETWIYWLHGTRPPLFNPITLDHPGVESKFTGWFLWKYRIRGIGYYALNDWSKNPWTEPMTDGHNGDTFMLYPPTENNASIAYGANGHRLVPSIRLELMRDSLEDYEYLYVLAGGQPEVGTGNTADAQADKVIAGLTSYTRDSNFLYNLRRLIGQKNGGEISVIPDIHPEPAHPRSLGLPGNYYINFQDPAGQPTQNPLVVNGKTYLKIGSADYNQTNGYGWYSPNDAHWMTAWISNGPNPLQSSILYSDWGRPATWEFDLPNGVYNVTLSVGWQGRGYSHHKAVIEGVPFVNDEATTASSPYIVRKKQVAVTDSKLTLSIGIFNQYTMLNYLDIEAANTPPSNLRLSQVQQAAGMLDLALQWTPGSGATTTQIRYATSLITADNWNSATILAAALPGGQTSFTGSVPYQSGIVFFAARSQNSQGEWTPLSNNIFWPSQDTHLPLIRR